MATIVGSHAEGIKADVLHMMGFIGMSIEEAVRSLDDRDVDAAERVIDRDRQVDEYQRRIEAECLDILAKKLEGKELRMVAVSYKMVSDIERIGDYCKAIANVTLAVANKPVNDDGAGYHENGQHRGPHAERLHGGLQGKPAGQRRRGI